MQVTEFCHESPMTSRRGGYHLHHADQTSRVFAWDRIEGSLRDAWLRCGWGIGTEVGPVAKPTDLRSVSAPADKPTPAPEWLREVVGSSTKHVAVKGSRTA